MPRPVTPYGRRGQDAFPESARLIAAQVAEDVFDWRVTVQRDMSRDSNSWGEPSSPDWQDHIVDLHCLIATTASGTEQPGDSQQGATINRWRLIFRLGTDITARDRLVDIRDQHDNVLAEGPLNMIGPVYWRAAYAEIGIEQVA